MSSTGPRGLSEYEVRSGRGRATRVSVAIVWLAFILFPIVDAATSSASEPRYALVLAATIAFTLSYGRLVLIWARKIRLRSARALAVGMLALAIGLTAAASESWGFLFSYVAACVALLAPEGMEFPAVLVVAASGVAISLVRGESGPAVGYGASALGVGLLLILMRDLRARNLELDEARAELARTAVVAERERFARDLHDLLGHSLSVIAIKAELAGRLLPAMPERAAREVTDVESVARAALVEVREAVSGYRRPTLDGELEGARIALTAAGIAAEVDREPFELSPEVEAVLAWAVREGATNVIRHSGARHCAVHVQASTDGARVEVLDDGAGSARGGNDHSAMADGAQGAGSTGNGLVGLRERVAAVRGVVETGTAERGGFRLAVSVPTAERS